MKVRGIFVSLLLILTCGLIFISGCQRYGDISQSSSEKAITAYAINGVAGTINGTGKTIAVTMPSLTNVASLIATFTTTGASVKVGSTAQVSGATINNFTSPITYTVTAEDGTTVTYTVTVTINRAWHNPASIKDNISPDGQDATLSNYFWNKQIAMDDNGNAIIVWVQSNGANNHIFKSEYRNGVWTNPASLSDNISPDGQDAEAPYVAMDNNGNAIIVWIQSDGANYQVFKSERRNGVWHNPASLSDNISPDGQDAWYGSLFGDAHVAMDNNGNAIIVWTQYDGTNWRIFKSEYRNGTWTHPANLADSISLDGLTAWMPQVAMDDNGNAIIVCAQSDGTTGQIFKNEYRNGTWTHPANPSDNISPDGEMALSPQVAMDNNGNAIVVWYQFVNSGGNIFYQIFKSEYRNGTWTNPANLADNISHSDTHAQYPQVEMDNNGNAIIVWYKRDSINLVLTTIFKSEYRNNTWTSPENISFNGQNAGAVDVAMNDNGNAIIVWSQSDGTNSEIFKSEYKNGNWINPASLSDNISPDGQDAYTSKVAMSNNGNAIIVWVQSDGSNAQIFKSEYR